MVHADFALARELGFRVNMHLAAGLFSGGVTASNDPGLLGPGITIGLASAVSNEESKLLVDNGVGVSSIPEDELNMGHGWPAVRQMAAASLWPNLGVDTCMAVGGDHFTAMRLGLAIPGAAQREMIDGHTRVAISHSGDGLPSVS